MVVGILIAAVHTAVAIMVHTAVSHVQLVHHVNHTHNNLWVMCSVAVNLYVEDMSTTGHFVIWSLNLCLMTGRTFVVNGHVVRVCVIVAIGNTRNHAKLLAVFLCELSAQSLGWCGQHAVVMMVALAEFVRALAHVSYYLQSQLLRFLTLAMMLTGECNQCLGQSDETDAQCSLIDNALDGIHWLQLVGTNPQVLHQQWELLAAALFVLFTVSRAQEKTEVRNWISQQHITIRWGLALVCIAVILVFGTYGFGYDAQAFIYGGF